MKGYYSTENVEIHAAMLPLREMQGSGGGKQWRLFHLFSLDGAD